MHRLQKARDTFQRLSRVWAARAIGRRTKIRLFNTLVRSVLLYGCETWKITKNDERNLNSFPCKSLRRIRIRIRILRREGENVCFKVLGWTPEGRRARGRPKTTWRKTVEQERNKAGWKSWEVAKSVAQDRKRWSASLEDLCAYWSKET